MRTIFYVAIGISLILIFLAYHPTIIEGQLSVGNPLSDIDDLSAGHDEQFSLVSFLGGVVVFIFYFMKFGRWPGPESTPPGFRPKPTRHFTTWLSYVGWAMVYGSFMLFCYLLIVYFPKLFVNFLEAYVGIGVGVPDADLMQRLLTALKESPENMVPYAVIIVTVVWSGAFAETERTFRRNLQELALIPSEANRLIDHYERNPDCFQPDMNRVRSIMRGSPFKLIAETNFTAGYEGKLEYRFAQCEYILDQISRLRSKRNFAQILARYRQDFEEVNVALNKLRAKLQGYKTEILETLRSSDTPAFEQEALILSEVNRKWEKSHDPLPFERRYFRRMWDQLEIETLECLRSILRIVICSVLALSRSPYQRNALLKNFGLTAPDDMGPILNKEYTVRAGLVIVLTMILCSGVFFSVGFMTDGTQGNCSKIQANIPQIDDVREIARWTIYAVIMHLLSIAGGYSVQKWLMEERKHFEEAPPDELKLSDFGACLVFGASLNIIFLALLIFPHGAWQKFQIGWPWALMAGVTGAFTGLYMNKSNKLRQVDFRLLPVQGGVTALFAGGVLLYNYGVDFLTPSGECRAMTAYATYVVLTTMLIGAALSYILQDWITSNRQNGRGSSRRNESPATSPDDETGPELTVERDI